MQEGNFEKQVRDKMRELSFDPSASVWTELETRLRKKREKRRFFFWMTPFLLLPAGLLIWQESKRDKAVYPTSAENRLPLAGDRPASLPAPIPGTETSSPSASNSYPVPGISVNTVHLNASVTKKESAAPGLFAGHQTAGRTGSRRTNLFAEKADRTKPEAIIAEQLPGRNQNEYQVAKPELLRAERGKPEERMNQMNSLPPAAETVWHAQHPKQKWQWQVAVAGGFSGNSDRWSGFSTVPVYSDEKMISDQIQMGELKAPFSAVGNDFSAAAGFGVSRRMASALSLTTGLRYHYFSTRVSTEPFNSQSFRMAAPNQGEEMPRKYTSRYHFIELPVGLQASLLQRLELEGGLFLARLVSAHTMQYTGSGYRHSGAPEGFRRTQLSAFAGLNYRLVRAGKSSIWAGPQIQRGLTNQMSDNNATRQYPFFAGIKLGARF